MNWYKPATYSDAPLGPLKNWSFSGLKAFEECPLRRYLEKVGGHRQSSGPAANRGSAYHDQIEQYIRGTISDLPKMGDTPKEFINRARERFHNGLINLEENWCINHEWETVEFEDRWGLFIIDYFERESETSAKIIDWKTGKSRNNEMKHTEQLMFYALSALARFPELEYIHVGACYIDENFIGLERGWSREQLEIMRSQVTKRAVIMTTATQFDPHPNKQNCHWCELKTMLDPETNQPICPWGVL